MPLTSSMEDYLEAVLVLQQQKGYVRCVDVAELLDVKKPSVSRAVKELSKKKCLIKKDDGTLSLTEQGQQIAQQIYEKAPVLYQTTRGSWCSTGYCSTRRLQAGVCY